VTNWIGRELRPADMKVLTPFVERAPRPASVFVKASLARGADFTGWWYGVWRDGQTLEAVMSVDNHQSAIYADNEDAARGLAEELLGMQKRLGPSGQTHRHHLICESRTMMVVWPILKDIPFRKILSDKDCDLLVASPDDDSPAPSSRVTVELATRADERMVYDFVADLRIEQQGVDPRKLGREAYGARITNTIANGREIIAKEKDSGRPFFVAELQDLSADTMMLTETWVPPHYRARGKLIAHSFWAASRLPAVAGKELLYLSSDPTLGGAAKAAGWKRMAGYRWSVTHG